MRNQIQPVEEVRRVYVHPDDHRAVEEFAADLRRRRRPMNSVRALGAKDIRTLARIAAGQGYAFIIVHRAGDVISGFEGADQDPRPCNQYVFRVDQDPETVLSDLRGQPARASGGGWLARLTGGAR